MTKYKHLFFDLDGTLWDFESNSLAALKDIFYNYKLDTYYSSFEIFTSTFQKHNTYLWSQYRIGKIRKDLLSVKRFEMTFREAGLENKEFASTISNLYITISPTKTLLIPDTLPVLNYLKLNYQLHIITNGFFEVQIPKLRNSGLTNYFTHVITSEEAGVMKPNRAIFDYALRKADCSVKESIMIGDDFEIDIVGARNIGMDQIYLRSNHSEQKGNSTYEITALNQLLNIL